MEPILTKVDDLTYKKITPQASLEQVSTLDELYGKMDGIKSGIQNNKDQVVFLEARLVEIAAEIAEVEALGVKKSSEVNEEQPQEPEIP